MRRAEGSPQTSRADGSARTERFAAEAAAIVLLAVASSAISNAVARPERRLAWFGRPPSATPEAAAVRPVSPTGAGAALPSGSRPDRPWTEITPEQAKALFDRGVIFFDARRSAAYREGHVAGARSISVWESDADAKVAAFVEEGHPSNTPIVVYCSGGDCEDSHELARKLWGVTFDDVSVYAAGFPDWERRGWPIDRGDRP